jgi:hypothetical protein
MKRLSGLLVLVILSTALASAQFLSFGVKGGLNYSTLNFDDVHNIKLMNGDQYNLESDEAFQGFHVGVMTRIKLFSLYLQPELLFNTAGGKVLVEELSGGTTVEKVRTIKYSRVDLPVMLGLKLGPARINAGPVASVVLSSNSELEDVIPNLETVSKDATIGYQAGAGLDIFKFLTLDYRFEGSLTKWGDKLTVGNTTYPFDSRTRIHYISVGILF